MEKLMIQTVADFCKGKKIVIWGLGDFGNRIYRILQQNKELVNMNEVYAFIDGRDHMIGTTFFNKPVLSPQEIKDKKDEYYVFIGAIHFFETIVQQLHSFGWRYIENYQYIYRPMVVQNCNGYIDEYGNKIQGILKDSEVRFCGYRNKLVIENQKQISGLQIDFYFNDSTFIADENLDYSKKIVVQEKEKKMLLGIFFE